MVLVRGVVKNHPPTLLWSAGRAARVGHCEWNARQRRDKEHRVYHRTALISSFSGYRVTTVTAIHRQEPANGPGWQIGCLQADKRGSGLNWSAMRAETTLQDEVH